MAEKVEDFEIELPEEDSPVEILNKPVSEDKFDYDQNGDDSPNELGNLDLVDMLPNNEENKNTEDEEEIDLGMDEIGDLVDDLQLDVHDDETSETEEGEADMVFEEEETEEENSDSVESLLDDLGEDESEEETEEIPIDTTGSEELEGIPEGEVNEESPDPSETDEEASSSESPDEVSSESPDEVSSESPDEVSSESPDEVSSESPDEVSSDSSDVLDMLHDPEIPETTDEEKDNQDIKLGMDALDDTKADVSEDLGIEETEIEQSAAEEIGIVDPEKESTEEWFEDSETKEDTVEELKEISEKGNSLESNEDVLSEDEIHLNEEEKNEFLSESALTEETPSPLGSDMLLNFHHEVIVEIARTQLTGEEITQITYGSIIELDKAIGEPVNLILDGKTIAHGEVVQINKEKLGVRIVGVVQE